MDINSLSICQIKSCPCSVHFKAVTAPLSQFYPVLPARYRISRLTQHAQMLTFFHTLHSQNIPLHITLIKELITTQHN